MKKTLLTTAIIVAGVLFFGITGGLSAQSEQNIKPKQESSLDRLIEVYAQRKATAIRVSESEILQPVEQGTDTMTELRSEIIDLRVERDRLESKNRQLLEKLNSLKNTNSNECINNECVPIEQYEFEKVKLVVAHWVQMHNFTENLMQLYKEDSEAHTVVVQYHNKAVKQLRILGFNPGVNQTVDLDELITEVEGRYTRGVK